MRGGFARFDPGRFIAEKSGYDIDAVNRLFLTLSVKW